MAKYGPPNSRVRSCGVQVEFRDAGISYVDARKLAAQILGTVRSMEIGTCFGIKAYLFDDENKYLEKVVTDLVENKTKGLEKGLHESDWSAKLGAFAKQHQIRQSEIALTNMSNSSPTICALPAREQKCIAVHEAIAIAKGKELAVIEVSQSVSRMTTTHFDDECMPMTSTFLPRGRMILFPPIVTDVPRAMTGWEKLHMMGMPWAKIADFVKKHKCDDSFLKDLAGNTFPGPILFCFIYAILMHMHPKHIEMLTHRPNTKENAKRDDDILADLIQ